MQPVSQAASTAPIGRYRNRYPVNREAINVRQHEHSDLNRQLTLHCLRLERQVPLGALSAPRESAGNSSAPKTAMRATAHAGRQSNRESQ